VGLRLTALGDALALPAGPGQGALRIHLHPGVPPRLRRYASSVADRCRPLFPWPLPRDLFLGHGLDSPARLPCVDPRGAACAVSLARPLRGPLVSSARVPLRVEIVPTLLAAGRRRAVGPVQGLLQELVLRGAGLWASTLLWPERPPRALAGADPMEWDWCARHERYLAERLRGGRQAGRSRPAAASRAIRAPDPADPGDLSGPVFLFLGFRFLAHVRERSLSQDPWRPLLLGPDVLRREFARYLYH